MSNALPLEITGMSCGHCVASVERALRSVTEVEDAAVRVGSAALTLAPTADRADVAIRAVAAIRDAGFQATVAPS